MDRKIKGLKPSESPDIVRIVLDDPLSPNTPQAFTVCVKDPADWEEIHNYIINENEIDGIPNRQIDCISEMQCSAKRSVYEMSVNEAEILRGHSKVEWVERSSMHNPLVLEQRKLDEDFDRHIFTNRFKKNVIHRRTLGNPGVALTFTQWGISRHSNSSNNFGTSSTLNEDVKYSLSGKHVDVVIMDTGVRWDHPDFLNPRYTSVPAGVSTETVSRVRDILIHGQDEYGINWASQGLIAPGTSTLANYTKANALNSSSFNGSWHGSHVAGTAAGNQFGAAFEANIWSIACIDRSDLGWSDPSDGFDYIRVWHKNKPINPITGRKNPTIVNGSWGLRQFVSYANSYNVTFRGTSYSSSYVEANENNLPAVYFISTTGSYYEFTCKHSISQATTDELFDDPLCNDLICVFAAGNSGYPSGKQDVPGGIDYANQFTSGTFYYDINAPTGAPDNFFNRPGTPAVAHYAKKDAPIIVGALDSVVISSGITSERKATFSNAGPAIDVWAAGVDILAPWNNSAYKQSAVPDPRNNNFYLNYLDGTSMAAPNVCGVLACYLESNPKATRVDLREWLYRHGSVTLSSGPGTNILDTFGNYTNAQQVGAGTSFAYWTDIYGLKGSTARILHNPFANNVVPSISINI